MNKTLILIFKVIRLIVIIGLCFVIILPLYKMVIDSISNGVNYLVIPSGITLRSYEINIAQILDRHLLSHSLLLGCLCGVAEVIFASLSGYALVKLNGKVSNLIFYLYLTTLFLPLELMEVAYKYIFSNIPFLGIPLIGKKYSIIIFYLFGGGIKSGIFVYLFKSVYKNFDNELLEQSYIDGCSNIKTFFKVVLPNSLQVVIPTFLLTFIWVYNDTKMVNFFKIAYDDCELISVALANNRIRRGGTPTAFIMIFPLLVIYIITENYFFKPFKFDMCS